MVDLSISQLHTLEGCEQNYWFQYVAKFERKKSDALNFGSAYDLLINRLYGDFTGNIYSLRGLDVSYLRKCIETYKPFYKKGMKPQEKGLAELQFSFEGNFYKLNVIAIADLISDELIIDNKTCKSTPKEISPENLEQLITYAWIFGIKNVRVDYLVKLQSPKIVSFTYEVSDNEIEMIKKKFIDGAVKKMELLNGRKAVANPQYQYCWTSACPFWSACELMNGVEIRVPKSGVKL
jgi:Holliday junction resolvase